MFQRQWVSKPFSVFLVVMLLSLGGALLLAIRPQAHAQGYAYPPEERMPKTPKERREEVKEEKDRLKIRATWDDRRISQTVAGLQASAVKDSGACDGNCISMYRCTVNALADQVPYDQYEYYFLHPLRPEDMNGHEREMNQQYQAAWKSILSGCRQQVDLGLHRNGTIAGLELQIEAMDAIGRVKSPWLEFFRSDSAISQYDENRVEDVAGKNHAVMKNVWLRQFSTNLNGNYGVAQNQYDCTNKTVQVMQYVVYNARNKEVFGDYMPSKKIPMDLYNKKSEDYALYLRLCPAPPEPEKKSKR